MIHRLIAEQLGVDRSTVSRALRTTDRNFRCECDRWWCEACRGRPKWERYRERKRMGSYADDMRRIDEMIAREMTA